MAHLTGNERVAYVRAMFGRIVDRYDRMNRLMTLGRDRAWRRYLIQQASLPPGGSLLDIAAGTGDLALEALRQNANLSLVNLDFSLPMMRLGQQRVGDRSVAWVAADALTLPFPDATFDAVTSAFLMRSVVSLEDAFYEQVRVVKPGGRVLCLDTTPPPQNPFRPFALFYLRKVIPGLGGLLAGDRVAYSYLSDSTQRFKSPNDLAAIMGTAGLKDVCYRLFMFGSVAVHIGIRPE